jgi:hypothetical protein
MSTYVGFRLLFLGKRRFKFVQMKGNIILEGEITTNK